MNPLLLFPLAFGLAGVLLGRWWVVALAATTWIGLGVVLRVNDGWYGRGWGELGVEMNVIVALLTVLAAGVGVVMRRSLLR